MADWRINEDGSFELVGREAKLVHCFPALDGQAVHPLKVEVERRDGGGSIRYYLSEAREILIQLGRCAEGNCGLVAELVGFEKAPHWFYPIYGAEVHGVERLFRQGIGFSGPSNFVKLREQKGLYSFDSYLCTGLVSDADTTIAIGALKHTDYMQQTTLRNRVRTFNFRNREVAANVALLDVGFSMERISLNDTLKVLPEMRFREANSPWEALRGLAAEIGERNKVKVKPPSYHWCSWYNRASHFTLGELQEFLQNARALNEPLDAVQIDDGYQESYGDWLIPSARWPGGLETMFSEIKKYGYTPGIWVGAYMVERSSELFKAHPDWVLHDLDGKPIVTWKRYDGSSKSAEYYILDTSHPDAMEYICGVFKRMHELGARFFKTDFLEWGFKDSTTVKRHTPGKTSQQYQREFFERVREIIGPDSYWLGCISIFSLGIGLMDSMRVSSDTGPSWGARRIGVDGSEGGVPNVIEETYNTLYLNNCLWQNDPDALILRNYFTHLSDQEVRTLALFIGQLGVSINTSDNFHELPADRYALWRAIRPPKTPWTARPQQWGREGALLVVLRELEPKKKWVLAALNQDQTPIMEKLDLAAITGFPKVRCFSVDVESKTDHGVLSDYYAEVGGHGLLLLELHAQ